jgi:hypothetical protein
MRRLVTLTAALVALTSIDPFLAQEKKPRASPHETTTATIDGAKIEVTYGRPYKKGRDVWNTAVTQVPSKEAWRLGADEATTLETSAALKIGNLTIPAGEYTLFLGLKPDGGRELIVNRQTGQWGTDYDPAQDLGRAPLQRQDAAAPTEQLTIAVEKNPAGAGGLFKVTWDNLTFFAPFTVQK